MSARPTAPDELDPPFGFSFEPEFLGQPPRAIPDELDHGPHARRARARIIGLVTGGVLCLLLARAPGIDVVALYFLPAGHLHWIGLGLLAFAGFALVERARRAGPYRYVRDGTPVAAKVLALEKAVSRIVNGAPSSYAIYATVALRDPERGTLLNCRLKSNDFSVSTKDRYDAPHRVGEFVTAVYFPGRLEKTLRLYAFLELNPRVCLRRIAQDAASPWKTAAGIVALAAFCVVLFANIYAFGRYEPIDFRFRQALVPMVIGGVVLGGGLLAFLWLHHRSEQQKGRLRSQRAHAEGRMVERPAPFLGTGGYRWLVGPLILFGAPFVGAATALCWCLMANAWLDASAAREVSAQVEGMTQTTHAFMFREYELEYTLAGSDKRHKLWSTPQELAAFTSAEAVAHMRDGRLGWPWVEKVVPAPPSPASAAGKPPHGR
jgi:hypothetical protein